MATTSRCSIPSPPNALALASLLIAWFSSIAVMQCLGFDAASSMQKLSLSGALNFDDVSHAANDFGNLYHAMPSAVLYPKSVLDIANTIKHIVEMGSYLNLTVAARGHGHSLQAQSQAPGGVVVMLESLEEPKAMVQTGESPYIEVSGGALWIDVLQESLKYGLAPKSWTDYLHLTVGGTLSNAGVSGQAFHHGPQISNVYQLEIVTGLLKTKVVMGDELHVLPSTELAALLSAGNGEVMTCSSEQNADLFFGALGGLGQFGIITRARIPLEPAPKKVKWIRVLYSDFSIFSEDQEMLVSAHNTFDYIEGFVIKNRTGLLNTWRSFLFPQDAVQAELFESEGRTLYCLELTKNFDAMERDPVTQEVDLLLSKLRYIKSTLFQSEVSYLEFLDRVHSSEIKLKSEGLWDVPHPWLNLIIPKTRIQDFAEEVFGNIVKDSNNGPIIIYPVNGSKWDSRMSAVFLEEEIFYVIAFLFSVPSTTDYITLQRLLSQNENILEFCKKVNIPAKQYLPHYSTLEEWKAHFGKRWERFVQRKFAYDPLAILAPGQRIFQRQQLLPSQLSILDYL